MSSFAATTVSNTSNYQMVVSPTLSASCPSTTVNLGTYNSGATTTNTTVSCTITQNRRTGVVRVTSSPAATFMNLTNGAFTYRVNFSNYATTRGTRTGTFATGVNITNPARGTFTFSWRARPLNPVATNAAAGTYTGAQTLTFSLI